MAAQITMQDLIATLRKAAANPEQHSEAQRTYFSPAKEDSVLVHRGRACCVASDLFMQAHESVSDEGIEEIVSYVEPDEWVAKKLGLTELESKLAFDPDTHYSIHKQLSDLLEAGLRLPDDAGTIELSYNSTYTTFHCAYVGVFQDVYSLLDVLAWMRKIAK